MLMSLWCGLLTTIVAPAHPHSMQSLRNHNCEMQLPTSPEEQINKRHVQSTVIEEYRTLNRRFHVSRREQTPAKKQARKHPHGWQPKTLVGSAAVYGFSWQLLLVYSNGPTGRRTSTWHNYVRCN